MLKNIVLEDYVEVKEQNIEIYEEILVMEEDPQSRLLWRRLMKILL